MAKARKGMNTKAKKAPAMARGRKKSAAAAASTASTSDKEVLVVGSKVKAAIKGAGCNTGGDAVDGLNTWVHWLIGQATARASANGRKTVRSHDFMVM